MRDALVVSAMAQLMVMTLLGSVTAAMVGGVQAVGPFRSQRRVLQAHLFWLGHAIFALALSAAAVQLSTFPVVLYIIGSWTAPLGSVYQAINPEFDVASSPSYKALSTVPIALLTVAFFWIAISTIADRLS